MNRYSKFFPSLLGLFILLAGVAANVKSQPVRFGVQAGTNISTHLNDFLNLENQVRLHKKSTVAVNYQVGVLLRKPLSPMARLQTEPTLARLGAYYEEASFIPGVNLSSNSRTELLYLQLPLVLQVTTNPHKETVFGLRRAKTTYHLTGGIFGGYLLDARLTGVDTSPFSNADTFTDDFQSYYPDFEAGGIFGFGLEHGQLNKFGVEVRALLSVINSDSNRDLPQNMAFSLSVYYIL